MEGKRCIALLDMGAQTNAITPELAKELHLQILPMSDLVNNRKFGLNGLGGDVHYPQGYVITQIQVEGIRGYDEDNIALVFSDVSSFRRRVPFTIGTSTIDWVVNVMTEGEIMGMVINWAHARSARLLAMRKATTMIGSEVNTNQEIDPLHMDEVLRTGDIETVEAFSSRVVNAYSEVMFPNHHMNVMTHVLGEGDKHLPLGLVTRDVYTTLKQGKKKVAVVICNQTDHPITVRKGAPISWMEMANAIAPTQWRSNMPSNSPIDDRVQPRMSRAKCQELLSSKLDLSGLDSWKLENTTKAKELLMEYEDIFLLVDHELGCVKGAQHEIKITDLEPFKQRFQWIPPPLVQEVRDHLEQMLASGVIKPSQSPWCNAVVLVRIKDGGLHFCIDFQQFNDWMKKDSYPLSQIQETLESLAGARHFLGLDFRSGFWQVPMEEASKLFTTFTVGNLGFFECERMPFGLCNAPATFQCLMQNCLGELNLLYCLIYLDDVIVFSRMEEEHLQRLRVVFDCFRRHNLKLKPGKCEFFRTEIDYLAHRVTPEGMKPCQWNLTAVAGYPMPSTYMEIHGFLGLVGHYQQFIKGFVKIANPLHWYLSGDGSGEKGE